MLESHLFTSQLTFLISYEQVVKDPNEFILDIILHNDHLKKQFSKYLDLSRLVNNSSEHNRFLLVTRTKKNILEWLAKVPFDYELNYKKLYDKYPQMYRNSTPLSMYNALATALVKPFTSRVYLYHPTKDKRIMYDIAKAFGRCDKITFCSGNYLDVLNHIGKVDVIIDNDIDRVTPAIENLAYSRGSLYLARYGYNYELDKRSTEGFTLRNDMVRMAKKKKVTLVEFNPFHITQFMKNSG